MMQCALFQSLLTNAVEAHADTVSEEIRAHAATCSNPHCAQVWADYSLLSRVVSQWRASLPQVDLTDRVLAGLLPPALACDASESTNQRPALTAYVEQSWQDFRSPQQRSWSIALAVAGIMLLIGTLIVAVPHAPQAELAVRPRNNPVAAPTRDMWSLRGRPAPNLAVQSVEWAHRASSVMADVIVSIPEKGVDWVPSDSWDVDWQHKLEPIRRDAHAAWDALLDKIPTQDQPAS